MRVVMDGHREFMGENGRGYERRRRSIDDGSSMHGRALARASLLSVTWRKVDSGFGVACLRASARLRPLRT